MAEPSGARRTNRLIGAAAALFLLSGALAWGFGDRSSSPSLSHDTTQGQGSGSTPVPAVSRLADVSLSWFDHANSVEQYDYEMPELSCMSMASYITTDLCAVVRSRNGDFMLVGTEGYWDPQETDSRGNVRIPLDLSVYVLTSSNGPTRAMSVLDGSFHVYYDDPTTQLAAHTVTTPDGEALVLHLKPSNQADGKYGFWDMLQVLAMSPGHAPQVVAAYEGSNIHPVDTGNGIAFTADRYASPTGNGKDPVWSSIIRLTPSQDPTFRWDESIASGEKLPPGPTDAPRLVDTYVFPNSGTDKADA